MKIWVDAQLSPSICRWLSENFQVEAVPVRDVGLRDAEDLDIFHTGRKANAFVMTKDSYFVLLLDRLGPPPQIIWLTCGNTSNARLKEIFVHTMKQALELLNAGEQLVEISSI